MKSGPPCSLCLSLGIRNPHPDCTASNGQCPDYEIHAMVIDSVLPGRPVRYQCKNTNLSNDQILVSSNWDLVKMVPYGANPPLEYIYEAISIQFSK